MNVVLIDPEGVNKGLNVGLGMLAACLKKAGHSVRVIDCNNRPQGIKERLSGIQRTDVVGISIKSFTVVSSCAVAAALGRDDLICGGPHITLDGENFLKENPSFRVGFFGEAETSLPAYLTATENKAAFGAVNGLLMRNGGTILRTGDPRTGALAEDLDALPDPDFSVFDSVGKRIVDYPVITSRGCGHKCIYCCVGAVSGRKMRFRSIERVVAEIERAHADYGATSFSILDDNFTSDINRAKEFCRYLIKRGIGMTWSCPNGLRADRIDDELADLMFRAGCRYASIGIESLEPQVFDSIHKGESVQDIRSAVGILTKNRIRVNGFFLIGLPGDSLRSSMDSLRQSMSLGLTSAHWNMFVPYPGTHAWDWVKARGRILSDWRTGFHFGPRVSATFETDLFSRDEMVYAYRATNIRSRNYSAFYDKDAGILVNALYIFAMIIRYDVWHVFNHCAYLLGHYKTMRAIVSDT